MRLDDALTKTMLNTAAPALGFQDSAPASQHYEDDTWRFDLNYDGSQIQIQNLECMMHDGGMDMWMRVCDNIHFGNPLSAAWATVAGIDGPVTLSFESRFLLRFYTAPNGGHIADSNTGAYRLEADISQGFQFVFGYEINPNSGLPSTHIAQPFSDDFKRLVNYSGDPALAPDLFPDGGAPDSDPLRIAVCVSLCCNKPRNDFDPGNVLTAARFYPLIEVIANKDIGGLQSFVRLARPQRTTPPSNDVNMVDVISGICVTDRNFDPPTIPLPPYPWWSNIFEYYDMAPNGRFRMAEAIQGNYAQPRSIDGVRQTLTDGDSLPYVTTNSSKQPGQAQYDSIHLAPKMVYVPIVSANLPATDVLGPDGNARSSNARYVSMAPFCQHDCMHSHWRWSTAYNAKWNCGWSEQNGEYVPYSLAGAPLVPPNQSVAVGLYGNTMEFETQVQNPRASTMQFIHHNGLGYALGVSADVDALLTISGAQNWADLYDRLRYAFGAWDSTNNQPTFLERLVVQGSALQQLMDL